MAKIHARFGPSTLDALEKCLRFRYGDMNADAASEGQELHECMELETTAGLTEEQALAVQGALDYVGSLMTEGNGIADWVSVKEMPLTLKGLTYGTADRVLVHRTQGRAHVLDWKFTRVEGDHDHQVETYAAALVEMLNQHRDLLLADSPLLECKLPVSEVTTHVVTPRLRRIDVATWESDKLVEAVRKRIEALYARIDNPFLPPTPDESLCSKCAWAAECPALGVVAVSVARGIGLPLPEVFNPEAIVSLRDRAIAQVLAGALAHWSEAIKDKNNEFAATTGQEIPGFALRSRSTGLRISEGCVKEAVDALKAHFADSLSEDVLWSCLSLKLGELATTLAQATGIPAVEVKDAFKTVLAGVATEGVVQYLQKAKRVDDSKLLASITQ